MEFYPPCFILKRSSRGGLIKFIQVKFSAVGCIDYKLGVSVANDPLVIIIRHNPHPRRPLWELGLLEVYGARD